MIQQKQQQGKHAYDLEKKSSTARLKKGKFFTETTRFMTVIQGLVPSTNNYKKYILNDPNITNNICKKCQEKSETIHHHSTCNWLTHCHNQVANVVHQELAIKCGLSKTKSTPYYKY
jgi:hypothetical protein